MCLFATQSTFDSDELLMEHTCSSKAFSISPFLAGVPPNIMAANLCQTFLCSKNTKITYRQKLLTVVSLVDNRLHHKQMYEEFRFLSFYTELIIEICGVL